MSRPSLKNERYQQIIDAYELCVGRYGVEGATLERIAQQAGLARPLIRHNVGNRDELMSGLMARLESKCGEFIQGLESDLPQSGRLSALVDTLFAADKIKIALLVNALAVVAADNEDVAKQIDAWLHRFCSFLMSELSCQYPLADSDKLYAVASGVTAIYANVSAHTQSQYLGPWRSAAKNSVLLLMNSLNMDR